VCGGEKRKEKSWYLCTYLLGNLKANYKEGNDEKGNEMKRTHTYKKKKTKQGNFYHLNNTNNSTSAISSTIM
jgi:hypothetical protein